MTTKSINQLKKEIYEAQPDKQILGQSFIRLLVEENQSEVRIEMFSDALDAGKDPIDALVSIVGLGTTQHLLTNSLNLISIEKRSAIEVEKDVGYVELESVAEGEVVNE